MPNQQIMHIPISELSLWTENPRDPLGNKMTDFDIIKRAISQNKKWNLQKLINEMGAYYDLSELPTVVELNGKFTVLDGNRRVAVLKYLQDSELYKQLNGGLYFEEEPFLLQSMKEIPCNVCDFDTALNNIERKHINDKSWGRLERDYFLYNFRNKNKSLFIQFEEQTQAISQNPKLNQRFVKEEILTKENLAALGFSLDNKNKFITNYKHEKQKTIIDCIIKLVSDKIIDTRSNRGDIITPLNKHFPELDLVPFNGKQPIYTLGLEKNDVKEKPSLTITRKTRKSKRNDELFGEKLLLEPGKVNDIYRFLDELYEKSKNDHVALQVIGMSMRLLLEVGARIYFEKNDPLKAEKDMVYKDFLNVAKKDLLLFKPTVNYLSLTSAWLNGDSSIEGLLGKYAHGNIFTTKEDVIASSIVVGEFIKYYFSKKTVV